MEIVSKLKWNEGMADGIVKLQGCMSASSEFLARNQSRS